MTCDLAGNGEERNGSRFDIHKIAPLGLAVSQPPMSGAEPIRVRRGSQRHE